ncbi:MAG TPA: DUF4255 domain-containing protein [Polyangia bacterium]|nr:DUF4255 domain-containing protein [Polyangia bacterium]
MSNSFAIAAVTATLRNLLDQVKAPLPIDPPGDSELADAHCTARPPDKARSSEDQNQLNLFLYQTVPNAAMRNLDMPGQTQPGETGMPPLAINLYYLLTAYGKNFDDVLSHRLLGRAMSILHDRALLMPGDIQIALTNNDAWRQIERIRITPHAMSTEEISKLWAVFQTPYRVSSAYEVSVVLIDSSLPTRTPLPVLTRGPVVYPDPTPPYPTLIELDFVPPLQPSARIGDSVALGGHHLQSSVTGASTTVAVTSPALDAPVDATSWMSGLSPLGFSLAIPNTPTVLVPGLYVVAATVTEPVSGGQKVRVSNSLPLPIAPTITNFSASSTVAASPAVFTVTVTPNVRAQQRATLLVGDTEFLSRPHDGGPSGTNTLLFDVSGLKPGFYPLRVRVDGVDSFIINYADPPSLDTAFPRSVTLT